MIGRDKLLAEREYLRTQQTVHTLSECEPRSNGVSCVSTLDGPVEQALFGESLQSIVRYHLDDEGRITRMDARITTTISADDPWVKFTAWMEATHPSVAESMTAPVFGRDLAAYEDSAIWLEYAPLWAEAGRP